MWMMGYTDGADFNMPDSINGRKLPRPMAGSFGPSLNPQCFRTINGHDLLSFNHHMGGNGMMVHEQQQQVVVSSRWNPTPEQLQTLEELYRRGTRTPSADQIQQITAQLRRYGKVEGKNVFYWFQNHKARERHKRRRHASSDEHEQQFGWILNNSERREFEVNRRAVIEVEETKGCMSSTNGSTTTLAEKTAKATAEWTQFLDTERGEIVQLDKSNTWQMMQFLSCGAETNIVRAIMYPKHLNTPTNNDIRLFFPGHNHHELPTHEEDSKTLQLFPLLDDQSMAEKSTDALDPNSVTRNFNSNAPNKFFEFLPLKN